MVQLIKKGCKMSDKPAKANNSRFKLLASLFGCLIILTIICGFFVFPRSMRRKLAKNLQFKPGSRARQRYLNSSNPMYFNVYLLNITNPDEITQGANPNLSEIGPYVFEIYKQKYEDVDFDESDTMEFTMRNKFVFRPDLTLPLTGQEPMIFLNGVIVAGLVKTKRERFDMLPFVIEGMEVVFKQPKSIFMETTAWNILWEGIPIDCNHSDYQAKILCNFIRSESQIEKITKTDLRFSLFKMQSERDVGKYEVFRGMKNVKDLGIISKYNEQLTLDMYPEEECDKFNGTDGLMFPPFLKDDELWSFSYLFCRSVPVVYRKKVRYQRTTVSRFQMEIPGNGHENCYCRDPENCPFSGTMDMSTCFEAPIIISAPHFYGADSQTLKFIDGLSPVREQHETVADVHMMSGTIVWARRRLMVSIDMEPVDGYEIMTNLPRTPFPVFWMEEAFDLDKDVFKEIKKPLAMRKVNSISRWILMTVGLIGFVVCLIKYMNASGIKAALVDENGRH